MSWCLGDDLHQQRVIVRSDDGASKGRSGIETDARAFTGTVEFNAARVWLEITDGVFGGQTTLNRGAMEMDLLLRKTEISQGLSFSDTDLRLDKIDAKIIW